MKKPALYCLILLLAFFGHFAKGQSSNKIVFERTADSSYTFYFDSQYYLTDKNCEFYEIRRVSGYSAAHKTFDGAFTDYDPDGNVILTGSYKNGKKEGSFKSFYPGGFLKWQAEFEDGLPAKTWYFYYPNGSPMTILKIADGKILILNTWNAKGKPAVKNGSGRYEVRDPQFGYNEEGYEALVYHGKVENGLPDGDWQLLYEFAKGERQLMSVERYSHGEFISGTSFVNEQRGPYTQSRLIYAPSEPYLNAERFISKECSIDEYYNFTLYLSDYLSRRFSSSLLNESAEATMQVQLHVNKFGEASRFSLVKSLDDPAANRAILQILNSVDYWIPSQKGGKAIEDTLTLTFDISSDAHKKILFSNLKIARSSGT